MFEADSPFQKVERLGDTEARGPGIIDMKGGNVIIVQALKALAAQGTLKSMNVTVVMTGDEEDAGEPLDKARHALVQAAKGSVYAIGFEDGPGPEPAVISRRGTTSWTLRVKGKPAHSSQIFRADMGYGAIFEAARILNAFREKLAGQPYLTFNPGAIVGGTAADFDTVQARGTAFGKTNVIAEHVIAGDMRTLSAEQLAKAKQTMETIVKASLPHAQATITFEDGYPPLAPSDGNRSCWRCATRPAEMSAPAPSPPWTHARRRRRRRLHRRHRPQHHGRRRPHGPRRPHCRRNRRPDNTPLANKARSRTAISATYTPTNDTTGCAPRRHEDSKTRRHEVIYVFSDPNASWLRVFVSSRQRGGQPMSGCPRHE